MKRKDFNLLVEGWRNFLNEEDAGSKREDPPGLGEGEFVEKYCEFFLKQVKNNKYNKFLEFISSDVTNVLEKNKSQDVFGHLIKYLQEAMRNYHKKPGISKDKQKEMGKKAFSEFEKMIKFNKEGSYTKIVYTNYKPEDKIFTKASLEEAETYIKGIIEREAIKANNNKDKSPFKETIDRWSKTDDSGNLKSK